MKTRGVASFDGGKTAAKANVARGGGVRVAVEPDSSPDLKKQVSFSAQESQV
jgi:hypothetical protein